MARAETAHSWPRAVRTADLFVWLWRLLASAQLAVALTGFLALAGLLAVVFPQIPFPMRDSPVAVDAWLEAQKGKFGPFTEPMHRVGLFSVVETWWFLAGLSLLAVSVCVYTADRFLDIWRNVTKPRELAPDSFFDRAANRLALATPADGAARLEAVLRRRRFQVRSFARGEVTYLFADRFAWARLGTFVSHLALALFLAGGLISKVDGYTNALLIAEGTTSPIFPVSHPDQIQVEVVDAVGTFDEQGVPTDYRSELVLYQDGREVKRGVVTVNQPLSYDGYRFHQAGYLGEGAAVRVRDVASGNTIYSEALALEELVPAPSIVVRDSEGTVLLDDVIAPTDFVGEASGTLVTVPGSGRQFWVGVTQDAQEQWNLVVYEPGAGDARLALPAGASRTADGLEWTFVEATGLPSLVVDGLPGDDPQSLVVLSETPGGAPYLTVLGAVDARALTLYPNQPVRIDDKEYLFEGRREFAGIEVRRDPGANFIWVAAGLLLAGLLMSFYVPRLRLWARIRSDETVVAGPAERSGAFQSEAKRLMRELGVTESEREGARDG